MGIAMKCFRNVFLATRIGEEPIPEIGIATKQLDDMDDVHFGMNNRWFDPLLDMSDPMEADLEGLGPRILDIKNRGGRTAEDTWEILVGNKIRQRGASPGFQDFFDNLNDNTMVKKQVFPSQARLSNRSVGGEPKYRSGQGNKGRDNCLHEFQFGTRWSKTALEYALAQGKGMIHFHLDDMDDLSVIFDKTGDYAYNVTSRELRYVWRNWARFQHKVKFYNGYSPQYQVVEVAPPWKGLPAKWEPDSSTQNCTRCNAGFGFFTRRHHCRKCGKIFCDNCCNQRVDLYAAHFLPAKQPNKPYEKGEVRVCTTCMSTRQTWD